MSKEITTFTQEEFAKKASFAKKKEKRKLSTVKRKAGFYKEPSVIKLKGR